MLKVVEAPLAGHPDKVCDHIVESIVDEYLRRDPLSRMDIQALGSHGMIMLGGIVDSRADFDASEIARAVYEKTGYADAVEFFVNLERPSEEEGRAIVRGGAQGTAIVHGYATRETREMLPRAVVFANLLARRIDDLRRTDTRFSWLHPDGKLQLATEGDRVVAVTAIIEHDRSIEVPHVQAHILENAIIPVIGNADHVKILVNPAGPFTRGGFEANAGVSGRKVLADTYGGLLPHGGIALAGKDPLKPGRAGTLMARFVAKQLVAEGVANNVFVTAVYSLGMAEPLLLSARSGQGEDLTQLVTERFDFRSEAIVERLNLRRPLYGACATYGIFGREGLPWEEVER
ncbi:MAG: S-adenosylmethionine synthase [Candidatus Uhrbacteria bacterium GW2011_GWD2_52_7]|uniref:S-adenosylmethionine synthase n=1 Tax=Candidatus Uhrbacteria bacterium GW2011_GWD2_52_7 TaxID=1618989 RepID=A0A0G2AD84_9BACT|nr:MAG: S-adenosylmethionine synthase [Candidatus Uhrbacteria bacterium GW2011_GWD2_52_7]